MCLGTSVIYILVFNVTEDLHINACIFGIKRYILLLTLISFNNRYGALYIDKDINDQCIFQLFKSNLISLVFV